MACFSRPTHGKSFSACGSFNRISTNNFFGLKSVLHRLCRMYAKRDCATWSIWPKKAMPGPSNGSEGKPLRRGREEGIKPTIYLRPSKKATLSNKYWSNFDNSTLNHLTRLHCEMVHDFKTESRFSFDASQECDFAFIFSPRLRMLGLPNSYNGTVLVAHQFWKFTSCNQIDLSCLSVSYRYFIKFFSVFFSHCDKL